MSDLYIKAQKKGVEGWNRPSYWPPRPDNWETTTGVYWLVENIGINYVYFQCNKPVNMYVNGVLRKAFAANEGQTIVIELRQEDQTPILHGGFEWLWIYFECDENPTISTYTNNSLIKGDLSDEVIPSYGRYISTYEEIISFNNIVSYNQNDPGAVYKIQKRTRNVCFREDCTVYGSGYLFSTLDMLQNIENFPKITHYIGNHMFRGTAFNNNGVIDLRNLPTQITYMAYQGLTLNPIKLINTSSLTNLNSAFAYTYSSFVEIEDCSNVTTAASVLLYASYLKGFKLHNLGASFDIACYAMQTNDMLIGIESLKDMTSLPSPTMKIYNATFLNQSIVIAAANIKNWTVVFV